MSFLLSPRIVKKMCTSLVGDMGMGFFSGVMPGALFLVLFDAVL